MIKKVRISLMLVLVSISFDLSAQSVVKLDLDDALNVALSENPLVKVADQDVVKSEYAKKGTYAALFPEISASASYQRTVKKQVMYMDFGGESSKIEVGTDNTITGGFSASMPLISTTLWESLKLSGKDIELAIEKARGSRVDMIEQVSKAFFGVLLAADTYDVYKEVHDNALANYKNVKQKYDVGSISEYEVIRADVQVKNAEPNMYSAEHAIALAKWQLKALMGMDLNAEIECVGTLANYAGDMVWQRAEMNIKENSSLRQMDIQDDQLSSALKIAKSADYPTLALAFNYNWIAMDNTMKFADYRWNPYGTIGFNLSVPIFSGGKRRSDIRIANLNIKQLQLQKENVVRNLEVAWLQYNNAMNISVRQYDVAKSSTEQAQKGYDIAVKRFEVGKGTQLEINDSQLQLTQAQLSVNTAIYDFVSSKVSLEALNGKDAVK